MQAPTEIWQLIIQEAIEMLPLKNLYEARLVNVLFADEINARLPTSRRLEEDQELFAEWSRFPLKRQYMWNKIRLHAERPCMFSTLVYDVLLLPRLTNLNKDQQHNLIDKIIDAVIWGRKNAEQLFTAARYSFFLQWYLSVRRGDSAAREWEPPEVFLNLALAASAIQRGDHDELQELVDQGLQVDGYSSRVKMMPMDIACKIGNKQVMKTMVAAGCPLWYHNYIYTDILYNRTNALSVAVRSGNKEGMEGWIEMLSSDEEALASLSSALRVAVRLGRWDMVEMAERCYTENLQHLEAEWLTEATKSGQVDIVQHLLQERDLDATMTTPHCKKGLIYAALHDCPKARKAAVVKVLLEHGADPNRVYPPITQTPLQRAMEDGDVEIAKLLVESGANVNSVGNSSCITKQKAPLFLARTRSGLAPLVHFLVAHGANRHFRWKGKPFVVVTESTMIGHVEQALIELGWSAGTVRDTKIDYLVLRGGRSRGE
ncbi:hypothetical protein N7456_009069 [Penicillium angulare]|uniref:Clr5 domain-containing protein n=1 Tax=Penicillium angulare TaxID=116970 RepID=A0A9W9K4V1_9EURO|nr:hypothetical protein N7456_009069 [Penicillium angulare]